MPGTLHPDPLMDAPEGRAHSVLLKLWFEPSALPDDESEWRGEVRHLVSGESTYFRRLAGIAGAVEEVLRRAPDPADGTAG